MPMLTGPQIKPFQQALLSAFTRDSLAQMLSTELNKRFEHLVKDTDFDYQVFQLIDRANREGWADGVMAPLPTLGGPTTNLGCTAKAINNRGLAVGYCTTPSGIMHAVLWDLWDNTTLYLPAITR